MFTTETATTRIGETVRIVIPRSEFDGMLARLDDVDGNDAHIMVYGMGVQIVDITEIADASDL